MRVDVKKVLFLGLAKEKETFFQRAQERGIAEFIDKRDVKLREFPVPIQNISQAIKVLRTYPVVEQEETQDWSRLESISKEVLSLHNRLENLLEEQRMLRQEIARVGVFGDFDTADLHALEEEGKRVVQFFAAKHSVVDSLQDYHELVWIAQEHGMDYFVSVASERRQYEGMLEMRIDQPVGTLRHRLSEVGREEKLCEGMLGSLAKYLDFLHQGLIIRLDEHHLEAAQGLVDYGLNEQVFAVEAWVPKDKESELVALAEECNVHCSDIAIEEEDKIPTALSNTGLAKIGEDLVHIYDTPGIGDKDPSAWVLWAFALFFAMILSDGGYGLIFLALSAFLYFKFPEAKGMGRRVMTLSAILSVSCILWGVLTNSFFGMQFDINSPVRKYSLIQHLAEKKASYHLAAQDEVYQEWQAKYPAVASSNTGREFLESVRTESDSGAVSYPALDKFSDNILLELALLVGVLHITLSFLRNIRESLAGLGWIAFMVGAYLFFPSMLSATSLIHFVLGVDKVSGATAGLELLYGGIASAVVIAVIQHRAAGAMEIMNLIQVFSDVLSYLRLYALGLAGGMMSATFNSIGAELSIVAGTLIILIGHTVNIVLSIMGGVIHGLRLNFLEWYHYSFEGGGKLFSPLRRLGAE
jgi:V/A-type H+-transporting ATPase subunit I